MKPRKTSHNDYSTTSSENYGYPLKQNGEYPTKLPPKGKPRVAYGRNYPYPPTLHYIN